MTARALGGILLDVNIGRKFARLVQREYLGEHWREVWHSLALPILTLSALGLRDDTPDNLVWDICQQQALVLLTCHQSQPAMAQIRWKKPSADTTAPIPFPSSPFPTRRDSVPTRITTPGWHGI